MNHSYCSWISLAGLNQRYHDTQRRWIVKSCYVLHTSRFQTASCTGYKGKAPTAHCFMRGTQRSHRFLTTTWSTSFPGSVLVHSPCADGTRSKLTHWTTHHLIVLYKEGNAHDSCVSLVCFSHLQSNGFHKVFLLSAVRHWFPKSN